VHACSQRAVRYVEAALREALVHGDQIVAGIGHGADLWPQPPDQSDSARWQLIEECGKAAEVTFSELTGFRHVAERFWKSPNNSWTYLD